MQSDTFKLFEQRAEEECNACFDLPVIFAMRLPNAADNTSYARSSSCAVEDLRTRLPIAAALW